MTRRVNILRSIYRGLKRNRAFAVAVILTIALGVGANVTMFSVVDSLLFRFPEDLARPDQLVGINWIHRGSSQLWTSSTFGAFDALQKGSRLLRVAGETSSLIDFKDDYGSLEVRAQYVTASYFDLLGVRPYKGRFPSSDENTPHSPGTVVVISYEFWKKQFAGDAEILNRQIWLDQKFRTVIGILPKGFTGTGFTTTEAWLPLGEARSFLDGQTLIKADAGAWIFTFGRCVDGTTVTQAASEASSVLAHSGISDVTRLELKPYYSGRADRLSVSARISLWLAGTSLLVFFVASANVANLFLVRVVERRQEMAVRLYCGASRWHLVKTVLAETLALTSAGGAVALAVVYLLRPLVRSFLFTSRFYQGAFFNWRMLSMAAGFALFAGLLSGLVPAYRASNPRLTDALKSSSQGYMQDRSTIRSALVAAQIAITIVLGIGAGLFIRSVRNLQSINLGFDPERVLIATTNLRQAGFSQADTNRAFDEITRRVSAVPGVQHVGFSAMTPLVSTSFLVGKLPSTVSQAERPAPGAFDLVSPDYFAALGMQIVQGRTFLTSDSQGAPRVVIINQSAAREFWSGETPLGKCLIPYGAVSCAEIVGVVSDAVRLSVVRDSKTQATFFYPIAQASGFDLPYAASAIEIRTIGKSSNSIREIAAVLSSSVPGHRYMKLLPASDLLDGQTKDWRLGASMFSLFSGLSLAVAAVGAYGVLAFLVRQRTPEIGIRMALGAQRRGVMLSMLWKGMRIVLIGSALGMGAAAGLSRFIESLLYGVKGLDFWSYAYSALVLILVTVAACLVPARRATRVDPMVALRYE